MQDALNSYDWEGLKSGTAEDALIAFQKILWYHLVKYIPRKTIDERKSTHPWLNERTRQAISRKQAAEGTDRYEKESDDCRKIINEERQRYVQKLKDKLLALPKGSKQWWKINRELLNRKRKISSIPSLKEDSIWITGAKSKADAFARTFSSKATLPPEFIDTPFFGIPDEEFDNFVAFRSRTCKRLLKKLDEKKATGHDKISASILKRLSDCIARPFAFVCRRLFEEGCWPHMWKYHLIVPIYK